MAYVTKNVFWMLEKSDLLKLAGQMDVRVLALVKIRKCRTSADRLHGTRIISGVFDRV
jgi:hypothetical protein